MQREREWVRQWYITTGLQGKTGKVRSMLNDEGTLLAVREYITSTQKPGQHLTAKDLAHAITQYWKQVAADDPKQDTKENATALARVRDTILALKELDDDEERWTLTSRAAVEWLHRLGYDWKEVKKGLYKDGHEREDVLKYRNKVFLPLLDTLNPRMLQWDENGDQLHTSEAIWNRTGQCPVVLVTNDECIFHANDGPTYVWTLQGSMPLRKKGLGHGIMLSEFLTPICRISAPLTIPDKQLKVSNLHRHAMESIEFGGDTWWTGEKLKAQTINQAIPLFKLQFPGCQALFLFDNARNHDSFSHDALRANLMNLEAGGKAPIMREAWYIDQVGDRWVQPTNWPEHPLVLPGLL